MTNVISIINKLHKMVFDRKIKSLKVDINIDDLNNIKNINIQITK